MKNNSKIAQQFEFFAHSLIRLFVTLLDWFMTRGNIYNVFEIVITTDVHGWKAIVRYWE